MGRLADRFGRRLLVPIGLAVGALGAALLIPNLPLLAAGIAVTVLSLGYDMTQPLLAGIVTGLGGKRAGQAMGLNVCTLFTAFGLGSLVFGRLLSSSIDYAFWIFVSVQLLLAVGALWVFRTETRRPQAVKADTIAGNPPTPQ
ncbi:MFS transporter [Paraburkholderia dilworthii]|uniref:MFS transporter n=1 Tax=Paraburkholderia dilworthii TaxID=948106 RepID=A0ABW9DFY3_9BURK